MWPIIIVLALYVYTALQPHQRRAQDLKVNIDLKAKAVHYIENLSLGDIQSYLILRAKFKVKLKNKS